MFTFLKRTDVDQSEQQRYFSMSAVVIFFVSLFIRLALIGRGPFHSDCLELALAGEKILETGRLHFGHSHGFPLTALLAAGAVALLRGIGSVDPVLAVNVMSGVFSSLAVWVFYHVARRIVNGPAALFSSLMLSFSPIYLGNSLYGNSHMPAAFFILLGLERAWRFSRDGAIMNVSLAGIFLGLGLAARLQDAAAVYPAFCVLVWQGVSCNPRGRGRRFLLFWGILSVISAGVCCLFYAPVFYQGALSGKASSVWGFLNHELFYALRLSEYWHYVLLYLSFLKKTATIPGLFIACAGVVMLSSTRLRVFMLTWFLAVFFGFSFVTFGVPRFLIMALFPMYFVIGYALQQVAGNRLWRQVMAGVVFLFVLGVPFQRYLPHFQQRHYHDATRDFAQWVRNSVEPEAHVIIADGGVFFRSAGIRLLGRPLRDSDLVPRQISVFQDALDGLLEQGSPVYITSSGLFSYDPGKTFSSVMQRDYCLESRGVRLFEAWHRGVLADSLRRVNLFRIYPKQHCEESVQTAHEIML